MAAGLLAACAKPSPENKVVLDAQGSWRSVGKLHGGNMEVFYDTGSLQKQGNTVSLRSRLVVRDMDKEPYLDTPHFKIAVNEWQHRACNEQPFLRQQKTVAGQTRIRRSGHGRRETAARHARTIPLAGSLQRRKITVGSTAYRRRIRKQPAHFTQTSSTTTTKTGEQHDDCCFGY